MKFWFVFVGLILFQNLAEARPEIIFENEVELTNRGEIYLGDVVSIKNPTQNLVSILESFKVDSDLILKPLNPQVIRGIYKNLVMQHPAVALENPKLIIPKKVTLNFVHGFSPSQFSRKLLNHVSSQCQPCEVSIEKTTLPSIVSRDWKVKWEDLKLGSSLLVPLYADEANSPQSKVTQWISVNLKIKRPALVAQRAVTRGEKVSIKDFKLQWMDVTQIKEELADQNALNQNELSANFIAKGKILLVTDLKKEPAALRGQSVKAILGNAGFEITVAAVAEENGQIGQLIKIKTPETKKVLSAVVIEKGVVRIQ